MKRTLMLFFLLVPIITSCSKSDTFIKDLEKFVFNIEMNYQSFSKEDWIKKDKEFTELSEIRFNKIKEKLSPEERSLANELIGKYDALKIKKEIGDFQEGIKDLFEQGKTVVKELMPDSVNDSKQK